MPQPSDRSRREFLRGIVRYAAAGTLLVGGGILVARRRGCRVRAGTAAPERVRPVSYLMGASSRRRWRRGDNVAEPPNNITRRTFLADGIRGAGLLIIGGAVGSLLSKAHAGQTLWQIDPFKCTQCGKCATACVLSVSAVKCLHAHRVCGYCDLCTGFFEPQPNDLNTGAENQLCPTGAIRRKFVEDPYYEYTIDTALCIGCGKCVKGCNTFGNGSLYLQIDQSRCVRCNRCSIAAGCPAQAITRVSDDQRYIPKTRTRTS